MSLYIDLILQEEYQTYGYFILCVDDNQLNKTDLVILVMSLSQILKCYMYFFFIAHLISRHSFAVGVVLSQVSTKTANECRNVEEVK